MSNRVAMRINRQAFRQYFKASGMSQRDFAKEVGVSHTLIGQILKDDRKTHVRIETAKAMEKVFDVPSSIVFTPEVFTVSSYAA